MMIAKRTYAWGQIEVRFEMRSEVIGGLATTPQHVSTLVAIMDAHASIQKTLDMLAVLTEAPSQEPAK